MLYNIKSKITCFQLLKVFVDLVNQVTITNDLLKERKGLSSQPQEIFIYDGEHLKYWLLQLSCLIRVLFCLLLHLLLLMNCLLLLLLLLVPYLLRYVRLRLLHEQQTLVHF